MAHSLHPDLYTQIFWVPYDPQHPPYRYCLIDIVLLGKALTVLYFYMAGETAKDVVRQNNDNSRKQVHPKVVCVDRRPEHPAGHQQDEFCGVPREKNDGNGEANEGGSNVGAHAPVCEDGDEVRARRPRHKVQPKPKGPKSDSDERQHHRGR